eukprot:Skav230354  [mRNA]  locus=scaffold1251:58168:85688:- [translate_table: standard]
MQVSPYNYRRRLWTQSQVEARRGTAFVQLPPEGFDSTDLLVKWLLDLRLRSRLTEETYGAALRGKGPPWHQALKLLEGMQKVKLEARAAACTAAMLACASDEMASTRKISWAVAIGFFQQMARWSVRPYDGTGAALASSEAMMERWHGALAHLEGLRNKGITRLMRTYTAAAKACESSHADWRQSIEFLEASEQLSESELKHLSRGNFWQETVPVKILTYSRGSYWNVALQAHQQSNSQGRYMSIAAYNALMGACNLGGSWAQVLVLLDEMYCKGLAPDSDTFTAAVEACGAANEWEWILQLYDELQLNNLPPTKTLVALACQACEVLGEDRPRLLRMAHPAPAAPARSPCETEGHIERFERKEAIADSWPRQVDAALVCIAQSLLAGVDAGGSRAPGGSVDAAELLGDLAVDSKHCLALLRFTLRSLGLSSGVAPKSKHVRHCCALILARLLTEAPASRGHSLELVFVQLALDKFAPIRLVALPGLAVLGTAQTLATLVEMVCSDPVAKIRQEALMQIEMLQAKCCSFARIVRGSAVGSARSSRSNLSGRSNGSGRYTPTPAEAFVCGAGPYPDLSARTSNFYSPEPSVPMCGIFAYIGDREAAALLVTALKRLEYRGYDSAGIGVHGVPLQVRKKVGKVCNLEEEVAKGAATVKGTVGIAHTRWATHGKPSDVNAHPHATSKFSIAVVHNGVIENHRALKEQCESQSCARHTASEFRERCFFVWRGCRAKATSSSARPTLNSWRTWLRSKVLRCSLAGVAEDGFHVRFR